MKHSPIFCVKHKIFCSDERSDLAYKTDLLRQKNVSRETFFKRIAYGNEKKKVL